MVPWDDILAGLDLLLRSEALIYLVAGLVGGFVVGVLPGFSGANAAALVLPFSIGLPTEVALILMAAIYAGASFAGSVPAILMNVPGTAGAAATAIDGYPLAKQGKAELAIGLARMSSALGGVLAMTVVVLVIGPLSDIALGFGARELFVVALFGLTIIASVIGDSFRKGMVSALLGLLIAAMSASPQTAQPRFTLGYLELYESVPFVPAIIGLFAITQMLLLAPRKHLLDPGVLEELHQRGTGMRQQFQSLWEGIRTTLSHPLVILRSSAIGTALGCIPGVGTAVANFISYGETKRRSKDPARFGKGAPQGIIASEACDNAVTGGTMVPTLTLGIPGSATAAVMLASLYLHGVQPGPRVMQTHAAEAYAVLLGLFLASLLVLPVGILLATPLTQIIRFRPAVLVPVVLMLCLVGAFAVRNSLFDAGLALVFGLLGYCMRIRGYPVVPLVLALILGPIAENNFMRALRLSNNDPLYFFESPTAIVMWSLLLITVASQVIRLVRQRKRSQEAAEVRA
jgi:putative tricarboxylic transport membrane protein